MTQISITITPIAHASLALQWGNTVVVADPVGDTELYSAFTEPNIIFVTHEHADHFSTSTLEALMGSSTTLVVPQSVADKLPANLKTNLVVMKNGDTKEIGGVSITAVPAYNLHQEALQFHPKGRDNGYVLEAQGERVYIAGDTEGTTEMRALKNIDIAFVPMNLPYTMSVNDAADAVLAFKPKHVYPYHYRGPEGLSDTEKFKKLVQAGDSSIEVILQDWYK
ncbi:MBL fold metallo-hydrolase [Candidatus Parcubacteria bacterium]|nr:MBL fold metallo-hydrolase [Candidatus Parcubacteria bacterium]